MINTTENENSKTKIWFDDLINSLEIDKFLMTEDIASKETKMFYNDLMNNNVRGLMEQTREASTQYFTSEIIKNYFVVFKEYDINYNKLAIDFGKSQIHAWVEISDDDDDSETKLILAEAKANAIYAKNGIQISTTIVETSDGIPVPEHYHLIK